MTEGDRIRIGAIVAALLLPPLGVWLVRGFGVAFAVSLVLTCLAYVPGIVFSVAAIFTRRLLAARGRVAEV